MNILIVHEVSYSSKVVYEYQEFAERLASLGHRVTVIDFDDRADGRYFETLISRTGIASVTLRRTPHVNLPIVKYLAGRANFPSLLKRAVLEGRVDVVLLYSVFINGTATVKLCNRYEIPVVYRLIDAYHKIRSNRWIELPLLLGERFIYRHADVICLLNAELEAYVQRVAGEIGGSMHVLSPGVDVERFRTAGRDAELAKRAGLRPEDRVVLFVGTLYPFCGIDRFLEGWPRGGTDQVKILVVGDGPAREALESKALKCGLGDHVLFAGARPFDEVPRWISLANVTINPFIINDITRDIIPIKILQYLACGKPLVSSPIPGVVRLLPEAESGIAYRDAEHEEAFAAKVLNLVDNSAESDQRGSMGRAIVEQRFSLDAAVARLEAILRSAVDSGLQEKAHAL